MVVGCVETVEDECCRSVIWMEKDVSSRGFGLSEAEAGSAASGEWGCGSLEKGRHDRRPILNLANDVALISRPFRTDSSTWSA